MLYTPIPAVKRLNELARLKLITPAQFLIGYRLLFGCRAKGRALSQASYDALARLTGRGRATVARAIARLVEVGWLIRKHTHVKVRWRRLRGVNLYTFSADPQGYTESSMMKGTAGDDGDDTKPSKLTESHRETVNSQILKIAHQIGARIGPQAPIRTVEEQIRLIMEGG